MRLQQLRAKVERNRKANTNAKTGTGFSGGVIEPCVHSFGSEAVLTLLLKYLESGSDNEKAGAVSALYWVRGDETTSELRLRIRCQMLREFVDNPDLEVRRRIIPMLVLDDKKYPEDLWPLTSRAIAIARSHSDEYIRHRVEIQLGKSGPLMPIPDTK